MTAGTGQPLSKTGDWLEGETARAGTQVSSSRSSLRSHLVVGDALALTATWVPLALVGSGAGRGRQLVAAWAAVLLTIAAMRRAGLYRSHVCALPSRETARVVASAALGAARLRPVRLVIGFRGGCGGSSRRLDERRSHSHPSLALRPLAEGKAFDWSTPSRHDSCRHDRRCRGALEDAHR